MRDEIKKQVEYYLSDANIVRDAFLKQVLQENNGWIPLEILNKFNRMMEFGKTEKELEDILRSSTQMEVCEGKIKRISPVPTEYIAKDRVVAVLNIPQDMSLRDIQKALRAYEQRIARISMRRNKEGKFLGVIFIELKTKEDANFMLEQDLKIEQEKNQVAQSPAAGLSDENESPEAAENSAKRIKTVETHTCQVMTIFSYFQQHNEEKRKKKDQESLESLCKDFENRLFRYSKEDVKSEADKAEQDKPEQGKPEDEKPEGEKKMHTFISNLKTALPNISFVDQHNMCVRTRKPEEALESVTILEQKLVFTKLSPQEVHKYCTDNGILRGKQSRASRKKSNSQRKK